MQSWDAKDSKQSDAPLASQADFNLMVFDSMDAHTAIVGPDGVIWEINSAWRQFAHENLGVDESSWGVGASYFVKYSEESGDTTLAKEAFEGIRKVQNGQLPSFSLEYPCHGQGGIEKRWFIMLVLPLKGREGSVLISHTNTTDRRQYMETLRVSEERNRLVLDNIPDIIYSLDKEGNVLNVNSPSLERYGYTEQESKGKPFLNFVHPEDRQIVIDSYVKAMEEQRIFTHGLQFRIISKNGISYWFELNSQAHFDGDGRYLGEEGILRDITERKQAEEALRRNQSMLARTEMVAQIGSWEWDIVTDTVTWSDELFRFFQRNPADGAPSFAEHPELYYPQDMHRLREAVGTAISDGTPYEIELRAILKDGSLRMCLARGHVEISADKRATRLFGSLQDITERKQIEEKLQRTQFAIDFAADTIVWANSNGRIMDVNDAACRLLGYTRDELLKISVPDIDIEYNAEKFLQHFALLRKNGSDFFESVQKRKDGRLINVEITANYIQFKEEEFNCSFIRDTTRRKQLEEMLKESERSYRLLADNSSDVIWTMDLNGKGTYISPSVFQLRGFKPEEAINQSAEQAVCPGSLAVMREGFKCVLSGVEAGRKLEPVLIEVEQTCKDSSSVWTEVSMQLMYDETGNSIGIFCKSSNITERRHLKVELQKQANTDELTGVINRRHFLELANIELKRAIRLNRPMAIVMIDLDYFKLVNDKHGHAAGDKILVAFTETCRKYIREIDIFARIGGDEFALLLPETSPEQASAVVERIRIAMMSRATHIACNPLTITISSGISISESKEESLDTLMSRADKALYQAKETGRNKIVIK